MADQEEVQEVVEAPAEDVAPEAPAADAAAEKPASRREGLAKLFDEKFESDGTAKAAPDDRTPQEKTRDEKTGQFKKGEKPAEKAGEKKGAKPQEKPDDSVEAAKKEPEDKAEPAKKLEEKPKKVGVRPAAWANQKALWEGMSDEARKLVTKREQDFQAGLNQQAERFQAREKELLPYHGFAQRFASTVQPYMAMMQQEAAVAGRNYDPLQTFGSLLQVAAALRHPDRRVGAAVLAKTLETYGFNTEEGLKLIGEAMKGGGVDLSRAQPDPRQAPRQQIDPEALVKQAEQRLYARLQAEQGARDAAESEAEVAAFEEDHEHFPYVRERMADIIEVHAKRQESLPAGQRVEMSYEQAYRLACLSDPAIAAEFMQAEAEAAKSAAEEKGKPATPPAKSAAPSSIRSRPGGALRAPPAKPASRREGLEQIMNQMEWKP